MLNAFRHQGGGHTCSRVPADWATAVLNAFRHQGGGHLSAWARHCSATLCSTPFGIREGDTRAYQVPGNGALSAQRLSASGRGTRHYQPYHNHPRIVLNAFRHQGGGHRSGQLGLLADLRVLNAFRHQGGGHSTPAVRPIGPPASAQRLSASGRGTRVVKVGVQRGCVVLNAFRHQRKGTCMITFAPFAHPLIQRCSTPFGIREGDTTVPELACFAASLVLNAFRHQGGGHASLWSYRCMVGSLCSTPFGINGKGHKLDFLAILTHINWMCSTPFGINGKGHSISRHTKPCRTTSLCAQRLSASTERDMAGALANIRGRPVSSAQRLSASGRGTRCPLGKF